MDFVLMVYRSPNADLAGERVQSFLWGRAQQGQTYVPGKESPQSRDERVMGIIQGVERHFSNCYSAQKQSKGGHSGPPSTVNADLNGVGQQF